MTNNKKGAIALIIVGILFVAVFVFIFLDSEKKAKSYDGTAEAIEIEKNCEEEKASEDEGGDKVTCYPKYKFEVDGEEYICESKVGTNHVSNNKKKVLYDTKDPKKCMTEADLKGNKFSLVGALIGAIAFIGGIILLFKKGE